MPGSALTRFTENTQIHRVSLRVAPAPLPPPSTLEMYILSKAGYAQTYPIIKTCPLYALSLLAIYIYSGPQLAPLPPQKKLKSLYRHCYKRFIQCDFLLPLQPQFILRRYKQVRIHCGQTICAIGGKQTPYFFRSTISRDEWFRLTNQKKKSCFYLLTYQATDDS